MKKDQPKHPGQPRDPRIPAIRAEDGDLKNSMGSTSVVPVAAPWILPPDWPPVRPEQ